MKRDVCHSLNSMFSGRKSAQKLRNLMQKMLRWQKEVNFMISYFEIKGIDIKIRE